MKCYVEFVTTPTTDTPGTLLFLHFDSRRYLLGNASEGTSRACIERGVGIRKVSTILLTGRTEWANVGGLLGLVLNLADVKHEAKESTDVPSSNAKLDIYAPPNLNHMVASSRRFIFRKGMPMKIVEHHETTRKNNEPTWEDECIRVWTMSILPKTSKTSPSSSSSPRKRSYDEIDEDSASPTSNAFGTDPYFEVRQTVVSQMFNSTWRLDTLMPQKLSRVRLPAKIFVRDGETKEYTEYAGPMPGGPHPVPDITVWTREPWPGALTEHLPPTKPALEAVSYIIRNYPQRGRFLPQKAKELHVPKGLLWKSLTLGETVKNTLGQDITPEMVLEPGKDGGGFAVIDLPSIDYLDALIQRPEWRTKEIMVGVEAIIWILGNGIASDERLQRFQSEMSHLKHIISSPDCCPNTLALEAAAANSLRHNHIDKTIFPKLQCSPLHSQAPDPHVLPIPPHSIAAQRGQILSLEPKFELQDHEVKPILDVPSLQDKILDEFKSLDNSKAQLNISDMDSELQEWQNRFHHGDAEIIVLGTGSSHPSPCRNVSGTLVRVPGCGSYLLDCGEGTLGTMRRIFDKSELETILQDLKMIWISHMHADHHLGLASVVKAWSIATSADPLASRLAVVSDAPMLQWLHEYGTAEDLGLERVIPLATTPSQRITESPEEEQSTKLWFVKPASADGDGKQVQANVDDTAGYLDQLNLKFLNSVLVSHCRGAQAVSITFKTGLKISYSGDCRPSFGFAIIGRNSHVLIHEATFEDDMRSEALAKRHSTAGEAFIVACEMKAQVCLLTHFSQRYPEMPRLGVSKAGKKPPSSLPVTAAPQGPSAAPPAESMLDDIDADGENGDVAIHPLRPPPTEEPSRADIVARFLSHKSTTRNTNARLDVIEETDIQQLKEKHDIKVLFAFDYMRIKLGDIPVLERKQPLLRQMYEQGIGKDMLKDPDNEQNVKQTAKEVQMLREEKKKAKAEKVEQGRKVNQLRVKASEEKLAKSAKTIAE